MINFLSSYKNLTSSIAIHLILGFLTVFSNAFIIIWFFFILLSSLIKFFNSGINEKTVLNYLIFYLGSIEVICRMAKTSPIIPYEFGKYFLFLILIFGILRYNYGKNFGFWLILFLLPATFYDFSNLVDLNGVIFNFLGPLNMTLALIYFYGQKVESKEIYGYILLILLNCTTVLSFSFFKMPDFGNIDFRLAANSETSGGFGSNQVSAILGLGASICFLFLVLVKGSKLQTIAIVTLFCAFLFQGLITFSRGGVLGTVLFIISFLLIVFFSPSRKLLGNFKSLLVGLVVVSIGSYFLFQMANNITNGALLQRYMGETAATQRGDKDIDENTITSNRYNIFMQDVNLFQNNIISGVGVGASMYMRDLDEIAASHSEMGRLLSEHGILGALYILGLFYVSLKKLFNGSNIIFKAIFVGFFVLGIYTSLHNGMRTYITVLMVGISVITPIAFKGETTSKIKL
jgi:hypothetical protein